MVENIFIATTLNWLKILDFTAAKNICRDNKNILCQGEEVFTQRRCTECVCRNGEIRCQAVDTGRCGAGAGAGCAGPEYLCGDAGEEILLGDLTPHTVSLKRCNAQHWLES